LSPGPKNQVRVMMSRSVSRPDRRRERGERARHLHDLEGGGIEYLQARRAVEFDRLDAAVGADRHREAQVAVELAARLGRIVHRAEALDLGAPILLVLAKRYSAALAPMNFLRGRFW